MNWLKTILHGDLFDIIPSLPSKSVNAVITSPPYAEQRKKQYGGVAEIDYPQWTVQWLETLKPIITDDGNVAIVIRPHVKHGQISDYVLHTRLAIRAAGWKEIDELIWIKPTAPPLGHPGRPRRSWESILWFATSKTAFCDPKADRIATISDRLGLVSRKGLGEYKQGHQTHEQDYKGVSRTRDYIEVGTHSNHTDTYNTHPAQYPEKLADWLIRLLCPKHGVVFDPFAGSGTTLIAAKKAHYDFSGTEINSDYVDIARRRLADLDYAAEDVFTFG